MKIEVIVLNPEDRVEVKFGDGPVMHVVSIEGDKINCMYLNGNEEWIKDIFDRSLLIKFIDHIRGA